MSTERSAQIVGRIRAEYLEMPGMMLRPEQVQRLCGVERSVCKMALDTLVEAKFLYVRPDGSYVRVGTSRF
jgi:DNA-binding IclR family transcriptional regulator